MSQRLYLIMIRRKKRKSRNEKLITDMNHILGLVCETLVDESKHHIEPEIAIANIRKYLNETNYL